MIRTHVKKQNKDKKRKKKQKNQHFLYQLDKFNKSNPKEYCKLVKFLQETAGKII